MHEDAHGQHSEGSLRGQRPPGGAAWAQAALRYLTSPDIRFAPALFMTAHASCVVV